LRKPTIEPLSQKTKGWRSAGSHQSGQRSLFTVEYMYIISCNLFCLHVATHLLTTGDGPQMTPSYPSLVSFVLISKPPTPHNIRCLYHYFLRQGIHHATQLNSKSNTEFNPIWINRICFSVCLSFCDLSRSRSTRLDWTFVSNRRLMKANGAYLFNGSYQIAPSPFLHKWTIGDAKLEV